MTTLENSQTQGSTIAAFMHIFIVVGSVLNLISTSDMVVATTIAAIAWYAIPLLVWLTSSNELTQQHSRAALFFTLRMTAVLLIYIGIAFWIIYAQKGQEIFNGFYSLLGNENLISLTRVFYIYVQAEFFPDDKFLLFVLIIVPFLAYCIRTIGAPFFEAYRASRGRPCRYWNP